MKILFITINYTNSTGGSAVSKRNAIMLKWLSDGYEELVIPMPDISTRIRNVLLKESYGNSPSLMRKVRNLLEKKFDCVFFNGSLFGTYVRMFAKRGFCTCCFYHNVEYNYFQEKYKMSGNPLNRKIIHYIKQQETLSTMYSNYLITLNTRDSQEINKIYGRRVDFLFPTSFPSIDNNLLRTESHVSPYVLFVGSNFFANVEGLDFLFNEVAPRIKYKIIVVGSVYDAFRDKKIPGNVKMEGVVDDLMPYYKNALSVVIPIFSGSGLKTKTIEALRYGKYVIGTKEGFTGVPIEQYPEIGKLCSSADEFVDTINNLFPEDTFNQKSWYVFNQLYSDSVQLEKLNEFLKHIKVDTKNGNRNAKEL